MNEGKIIIMERGDYKTAKRSPDKKKKKNRKRKIERNGQGESCRVWRKSIILRWPYLCHQPLDHDVFWICCSYYTYLLTDRRDWKKHNPFDRNHHHKCPGEQKRNAPAGQFGRRPISLSYTVGSCSFLDIWCA